MAAKRTPQSILKAWADDALQFVMDNFKRAPNFEDGPDAWQRDGLIMISQPSCDRLAMCACKGPGKTTWLSWVAQWFMATRYQANIAAISVTGENLRDGLHKEIAKWMQYSDFMTSQFELNSKKLEHKEHAKVWWMAFRTWGKAGDKTAQDLALAGLHQDHIMMILDEAGGIPSGVMATAEATMSTQRQEHKIVLAGNPTHLSGPLHDACVKEREKWQVYNITGDPDDPKRSPRISINWARDMIEKYGRNNPWVMVNVLGQFPPSSMNSLFGDEDIAKAMTRRADDSLVQLGQRRIAIDTARFGDDRIVFVRRQGPIVYPWRVERCLRTSAIVDIAAAEAADFDAELIFVDSTGGYGAGTEDGLIQLGLPVVPVQFAGKAIDGRYANKRAEMYFGFSEWVKRIGVLPDSPDLRRELLAMEYNFQGDKLIMISKDLIKAKLGESPDIADAIAMTFALPDVRSSMFTSKSKSDGYKWDYDPYNEGHDAD